MAADRNKMAMRRPEDLPFPRIQQHRDPAFAEGGPGAGFGDDETFATTGVGGMAASNPSAATSGGAGPRVRVVETGTMGTNGGTSSRPRRVTSPGLTAVSIEIDVDLDVSPWWDEENTGVDLPVLPSTSNTTLRGTVIPRASSPVVALTQLVAALRSGASAGRISIETTQGAELWAGYIAGAHLYARQDDSSAHRTADVFLQGLVRATTASMLGELRVNRTEGSSAGGRAHLLDDLLLPVVREVLGSPPKAVLELLDRVEVATGDLWVFALPTQGLGDHWLPVVRRRSQVMLLGEMDAPEHIRHAVGRVLENDGDSGTGLAVWSGEGESLIIAWRAGWLVVGTCSAASMGRLVGACQAWVHPAEVA